MGPKFSQDPNFSDSNFFRTQIFSAQQFIGDLNFFLDPNILGPEIFQALKILETKFLLDPNFFETEIFMDPNFYGPKFFRDQNFVGTQNFSGLKFFQNVNFFEHKLFGTPIFWGPKFTHIEPH